MKTPKYIRINRAVEIYSLSRSTFYRAFEAGELSPIKRGGAVLLEVTAIDQWITGNAPE
ncbi:helix-turn-helix transcriptional regulator [Halocynthiibacter styelae]|uniref:Helix-turn-helix domain-containing protein n=1 Tax=Halocynthiibacter styelae TaxID=2761955 RepID=A0A8J7LQ94_9RHOB|nr:helix-turn-helix domain-containing protein [Paenihalocynthiibacter styelae]